MICSAKEREAQLILCAQSGDRDAQGELLAKYEHMLRGFVGRTKYRNRHDGDDLYQEACIAFLNAVKTYRRGRGTEFGSWLHHVIPRRLWKVAAETLVRVPHSPPERHSSAADRARRRHAAVSDIADAEPVDEVERRDELEWLRRRMNSLPGLERRIVDSRLAGMALRDVASSVGLPYETTRKLERQALGILR